MAQAKAMCPAQRLRCLHQKPVMGAVLAMAREHVELALGDGRDIRQNQNPVVAEKQFRRRQPCLAEGIELAYFTLDGGRGVRAGGGAQEGGRHQRGAMLVDAAELANVINAHNRDMLGADARSS